MSLADANGRRISYLRLSVTDRCNLRCRYCIPESPRLKECWQELLSLEDLHRIARAAVEIGMEKIRITGGEPLLRPGLISFLASLQKIKGLREVTITTNGILLAEMAQTLRDVGVVRLNVSMDSLRADRFHSITRGGQLERVRAGLEAVQKAGFPKPKLNVVVMRGVNDDEVLDFSRMAAVEGFSIRFIEYMPTEDECWPSLFVPGREIVQRIASQFTLDPLDAEALSGPATYFRIRGSTGVVGVITPVSHRFCNICNRVRVTAAGIAKGCLFGVVDHDLRPYLQNNDDAGLQSALRQVVRSKPHGHKLRENAQPRQCLSMYQIGG